MVRKVYFQTLPKGNAAGADVSRDNQFPIRVCYSSSDHITTGVNTNLIADNIEITVPDSWGSNTLNVESVVDAENNATSIFYVKPLADSFSINIIIKANGSIERYYKLRDKFLRAWGTGEFTIILESYDGHGGKQCVNGYLSSFAFEEFRSAHTLTAKATFTPTTPWFFEYANSIVSDGESQAKRFGDCEVVGGQFPSADGYSMIPCNFLEILNISNVGDLGFKFKCIDLADPMSLSSVYILPDDFESVPDNYTIISGYVYGWSAVSAGTRTMIGRIALPQGILAFGVDENAMVRNMHYSETYDMLYMT
ncbi:MAG: hypothetical protein EOM50_04955 [Erysipelotrichia bacterium]|nr:hypothetical protein [Erysipelotrichia bacterium]